MMKLAKRKKFNIKKLEKIIDKKNKNYKFFLFMMGLSLNAIAVSLFYSPNGIVTGGASGLSIILNHYFNIDLSLIILFVSSILLILSFLVFGFKYGLNNAYGTFLFPIFVKAATLLTKVIDLNNTSLFLLVICGGFLSGLGFGLVKKSGYSLGGFYFLYDLIHEKFKVSMGTASLICNIIIISIGAFAFGFNKAIYAIIALYVNSYIGDKIVLGISRNKAFYIVTSKSSEVKEYLFNKLNYKITVIDVKGGYSKRKKEMLFCVIPTIEYVRIKEVIKEVDKNAFFLITDSYSISK